MQDELIEKASGKTKAIDQETPFKTKRAHPGRYFLYLDE